MINQNCAQTLSRPIKHEVVTGDLSRGKIECQLWAGEALYFAEEDYFQLQLAVFPFPYYVSRNKDSKDQYTVWAQKVKEVTPALFRRPVGKATLEKNLKSHLEIQIPMLALKYNPLLCLYPSH